MKRWKKGMALALAVMMTVSNTAVNELAEATAAGKGYAATLKVAKKKVTVKERKTKKIKYKVSVKGKAATKVTVKVKNKKIASASVKKSMIVIKGKKKGSTVVTVTTKASGKSGRKLQQKIAVKVRKNNTVETVPNRITAPPTVVLTPQPTRVPVVTPTMTYPYRTPSATSSVKPSQTPYATETPEITEIPEPTATATEQPGAYTRSQWLKLLAAKVGLEADSAAVDEDIYYYGDTAGESYGQLAEAAHAYDILPECDAANYTDPEQDIPVFEADRTVTREYATYTAVKALGFVEDEQNTLSCDDASSLKYGSVDEIGVDQDLIALEDGEFCPQEALSQDDGEKILEKVDAIENSASTAVGEAEDKVTYQSGVIQADKYGVTDYTVEDNGDDTYTITVKKGSGVTAFAAGDIVVFPENSENIVKTAYQINRVSEKTDTYVYTCEKPELAEVLDEVSFAGTLKTDDGEIEPAEGVTATTVPADTRTAKGKHLGADTEVQGPGTFELTFAEKELTDHLTASGSVSIALPSIRCKLDADIGLRDGVQFHELLLSIKNKATINAEISASGDLSRFEDGKKEIGHKDIPLGSSGMFVSIIFFLQVKADGTLGVGYSLTTTQGIQVLNNQIRLIKSFDPSLESLSLEGDAKGGLGLGVALNAFKLMDLVRFDASAGLGLKGSVTPHPLADPAMICIDGKMYLYATLELSKEAALGRFLSTVRHIEYSWDIFDEDNSPLKTGFHVENTKLVDKCTFGEGSIEGLVFDGNYNPIAYARISLYQNGVLIQNTYTDAEGRYNTGKLSVGDYQVRIAASGYAAYETTEKVEKDTTTYAQSQIILDRGLAAGEGSITGDIVDAKTGDLLENVKYYVYNNWSVTTGTAVTSGKVSERYSLNLDTGNYTIHFVKDGYIDTFINVAISADDEQWKDVALSPELKVDDELIRVVLTWGEVPEDLDSHMTGPVGNGAGRFHIYFANKNAYYYDEDDNETPVADLDVDDTSSYGPETVTLRQTSTDDTYSYYVHDYTNRSADDSDALSLSGAQVTVYKGSTVLRTFNVPAGRGGTLWHVFDYNARTNTITPVNTMEYHYDEDTVGSTEDYSD